MDEVPRPGRRRGLALGLAGVGTATLLWALWGFVGVKKSDQAPGITAGGAASAAELCRRSVPADLAQACVEAARQRSAAALRRPALAAALGGFLIALSAGVSIAARRQNRRRDG